MVGMHFVLHEMGDLLSVLAPASVLGLSAAPKARKHCGMKPFPAGPVAISCPCTEAPGLLLADAAQPLGSLHRVLEPSAGSDCCQHCHTEPLFVVHFDKER